MTKSLQLITVINYSTSVALGRHRPSQHLNTIAASRADLQDIAGISGTAFQSIPLSPLSPDPFPP